MHRFPFHIVDGRDSHLASMMIEDLAHDKVAGIHFKQVVPGSDAEKIAERYISAPVRQSHDNVDNLEVLGKSHYMAVRDPVSKTRYFSQPNVYEQAMREMATGCKQPLDSIVDCLCRGWKAGVEAEQLHYGEPMSPFIVRIYAPGYGVKPHQDDIRDEVSHCQEAVNIQAQFGLNLYLSMPDKGGELELYMLQLPQVAYDGLRLTGRDCYAVDASCWGKPLVTVRPEVGDLILFNSRLLHAVTPGQGSRKRVTLSAFVGYRDETHPLTIWA